MKRPSAKDIAERPSADEDATTATGFLIDEIVREGARRMLAAAGGLGDGTVHGDLVQDETDDAVVGLKRDLLQAYEQPRAYPLVAAAADRGGRARGVCDRLIGAAEAKDLQQFVEDDPVADPASVAARRVGRIELGPLWQQDGELVAQRFGQP